MSTRPFNIAPKKVQVSKVQVKKRNKNDMRKVANQKTYLQYRITLPESFMKSHKLAKSRLVYLITDEIGIFTATEDELTKIMLLLPEIRKIIQSKETSLTKEEVKVILQHFPEIADYVRNCK